MQTIKALLKKTLKCLKGTKPIHWVCSRIRVKKRIKNVRFKKK